MEAVLVLAGAALFLLGFRLMGRIDRFLSHLPNGEAPHAPADLPPEENHRRSA